MQAQRRVADAERQQLLAKMERLQSSLSASTEGAPAPLELLAADSRELGVPPSLGTRLKSVAAVQKLSAGNEAVLSIASELGYWRPVRESEALRRKLEALNAGPHEGVPP